MTANTGNSKAPASGPEATSPARTIRELGRLQQGAVALAAGLVRLWAGSLRYELSADQLALVRRTEPAAFVFWHNRLLVIAEMHRRYVRPLGKRIFGLVSASGDGAWLAAFFARVGIGSVRGSSSWRGTAALRGLRAQLKAGHDIGITPDGPRGPCYRFQPGVVAATGGGLDAPVILVSVTFQRAWRLRSWDGFYVPWPFSRATIHLRQPEPRQPGESAAAVAERWGEELQQMTHDSAPLRR